MTGGVLNKRRITYTHSNAKDHGSWDFNCWGATLFVLNQADKLQWLDCDDMQEWLDKNTTRIYRPRKAGDIVAVHDDCLEHTAVYLGRGRYFHKKGAGRAEVTTLDGIREIYSGEYTFYRLKEAMR